MKPANFDGLATGYRTLEYLAFGRDLERARFCLLDRLAGCRSILVLGEGDGRCLEQLVRIAPSARIHCVDASEAMLAQARARLGSAPASERVTLQKADALTLELPAGGYDAAVTLFFLDCFTTAQVEPLVARIERALQADAWWLFADFAVPPRGWARARARAWLTLLYAFFRWRTRMTARVLPPSEMLIERAGFRAQDVREHQRGMLRTVAFRRR